MINIAENYKEENDRIVLQLQSFQSFLQRKKGLVVSDATIRTYGFNGKGYWVKEFPDYFDWYSDGSTRDRGLIIYCKKVVENKDEILENLPE